MNRLEAADVDALHERLLAFAMRRVPSREIAEDLGSAREVISRLMKKLEKEGVVRQAEQGWIEVL